MEGQRSRMKPRYEEEIIQKKQHKLSSSLSSSSWIDLPQDILAIVYSKLYVVDQIRFRAICKSWRIPDDMIIHDCCCLNNMTPWAVTYSWKYNLPSAPDHNFLTFECRIVDPRGSEKVHTFSNTLCPSKYQRYTNLIIHQPAVYATLQGGWALVGWAHGSTGSIVSFFIHNVFTNRLITLPRLLNVPHGTSCVPTAATFLNNHTEIFVLFHDLGYFRYRGKCYTATFRDGDWISLGVVDHECMTKLFFKDLQYIKGHGKLYFLYEDGTLRSYSLGAKSSELVSGTNTIMEHFSKASLDCWLVETTDGRDLIMVANKRTWQSRVDQWLIFKFDWSRKCWTIETSLKNIAIFTNGCASSGLQLLSLSSSFLTDSVEKTQDCRVFFTSYEGRMVLNCYSFTKKKLLESEEYRWSWRRNITRRTTFIHLPYVKH